MSAVRETVAQGTHMFQRGRDAASDAVRAQLQRDTAAITAIGAEVAPISRPAR